MNLLQEKTRITKAYQAYNDSVHGLRAILTDVVGKTVQLTNTDDWYMIKTTFVSVQDAAVSIEIQLAPIKNHTNINGWCTVQDTRVNWKTLNTVGSYTAG